MWIYKYHHKKKLLYFFGYARSHNSSHPALPSQGSPVMPTWHATGFAKQECREEEGKGSKPNIVFKSLENNLVVLSYRQVLKNKSGVYCFINTVNGKQYIGSAKDLYLRLVLSLCEARGTRTSF